MSARSVTGTGQGSAITPTPFALQREIQAVSSEVDAVDERVDAVDERVDVVADRVEEVAGIVGGTNLEVHTTSASYTAGDNDETVLLVNANSSGVTITLPAASGNSGRFFHIKKIDASSNDVVIDGNGSETIDGEITASISTPFTSLTLVCDGNDWFII